jgi:hypothetical protein
LNLFGPEVLDKNLDRIGDLIAIANGEFIMVEAERQELQLSMVGHHGGTTQAETAIPLLSADI